RPCRTSRRTDVGVHVRERVGVARARRREMASSNVESCNWARSCSRALVPPMFADNSAKFSSRCWAISSTSSASSCGLSRSDASRARTAVRQSCIAFSGNSVDGGDELAPTRALGLERGTAGRGELVEAPAPLAGFLDPAADDPAAVLHAVEQRIERRDVEAQNAARPRLDELLELISVPRLGVEQSEDEKFGAALFQLVREHVRDSYMSESHIYEANGIPASRAALNHGVRRITKR